MSNKKRAEIAEANNLVLRQALRKIQELAAREGFYLSIGPITEPILYGDNNPSKLITDVIEAARAWAYHVEGGIKELNDAVRALDDVSIN